MECLLHESDERFHRQLDDHLHEKSKCLLHEKPECVIHERLEGLSRQLGDLLHEVTAAFVVGEKHQWTSTNRMKSRTRCNNLGGWARPGARTSCATSSLFASSSRF